jgi:hypothetical protein
MQFLGVKSAVLAGVGFAMAAAIVQPAAAAAKFKVIYSFCSQGGSSCTDGGLPHAGLVADPSGNLYGYTSFGGANGNGTIFELVRGSKDYTYKVLYSPAICDPNDAICPDGGTQPATVGTGPLIVDTAGNLYGVFQIGGPHDEGKPNSNGVLFKLTPGAKKPFQVLHVFCKDTDENCADGANPESLTYIGAASGAPYDGTSTLYGSTYAEGPHSGGTSYTFTPKGGLHTTHAFCAGKCGDGASPVGYVAVDDGGNLYGANTFTEKGGALIWAQAGSQVLHRFSGCPDFDPCDGTKPDWGVWLEQGSNTLFGTNSVGGKDGFVGGHGTVYSLDIASGKLNFDISFCQKTNCADTGYPSSTVTLNGEGDAFGTTYTGGNGAVQDCGGTGCGTVYYLNIATKKLKVLYSFGNSGDDAVAPFGGVIAMGDGLVNPITLFGTTYGGGANGSGTVYELTP